MANRPTSHCNNTDRFHGKQITPLPVNKAFVERNRFFYCVGACHNEAVDTFTVTFKPTVSEK